MQYYVYRTKEEMGAAAADLTIRILKHALIYKPEAGIIHATGASQFSLLNELVPRYRGEVPVSRLKFFHLDEYVNLPGGVEHPASFRKYLKERIADPLGLKEGQFVYVNSDAEDIDKECKRLGIEIRKWEIDVALIGIGENGHIAFNDPPADFVTTEPYIVVDLDEKYRRQQLGEGWFDTLEDVPKRAISMSVYEIMRAKNIICTVPDERKAQAVVDSIEGVISRMCPGSKLQEHPNTHIFLDARSAMYLNREFGKPIEVKTRY